MVIEHLPPLIRPDADPWLTGPMPDPSPEDWARATGTSLLLPGLVDSPCGPVRTEPVR